MPSTIRGDNLVHLVSAVALRSHRKPTPTLTRVCFFGVVRIAIDLGLILIKRQLVALRFEALR